MEISDGLSLHKRTARKRVVAGCERRDLDLDRIDREQVDDPAAALEDIGNDSAHWG